MDETPLEYQAAQFRVALLLKQYKFGAASAAKYLGKSRGLIQSWMQIGNKHYLAKEKIKLKSFEKIVKNLRKTITKENLDYFLVMKLLDLELPVAYISKIMELPTSTVRSWNNGKVPCEIKKFFHDPKLVNREFNKLMRFLRSETTRNNLEYFLAIRIAEAARESLGRRRIGGRIISQILTRHFGHLKPLPEKTVSCWIDGKRKPWDAFSILTDEQIIKREFSRVVDEQTYEHLTYHVSMVLSEKYGWSYSKISKKMVINKELVRGWVKKSRGSPIAKTFRNPTIVNEEVKKYITDMEFKNGNNTLGLEDNKTKNENVVKKPTKFQEKNHKTNSKNIDYNEELEQELIYHLETIPTGVTSAKILKSILIEHSDVTVIEIEKILQNSTEIVKSRRTRKWILKRFERERLDDDSIDDDLSRINCKLESDDEVVCSD